MNSTTIKATSILKSQLDEEKNLRRFTEDVLDSRQEELELKEAKIVHLTQNLQRIRKELSDTRIEVETARSDAEIKSQQLEKIKDHVFRLQPRRIEITETEAKLSYTDLCKGIRRWVESRMAASDTTGGVCVKSKPGSAQACRLISLVREPARHCIDVDSSDEYHVFAVIMNYLWLALFSRSFYCPLDDSENNATQVWIDKLEKVMSQTRDAACSRNWRGETLVTLVNQSDFQTVRVQYLDALSKDLASFLSPVVSRGTQLELQKAVKNNIIQPAADLAHQLHLATAVFTLKWPVRHAWSRLEVYDCTNIAAGGLPIDFHGTDSSSAVRQNVSYLFDLAPGLFVERIESGKKMTAKAISRPQVLVLAGSSAWPQAYTMMRFLSDIADPETPSVRRGAPKTLTQRG